MVAEIDDGSDRGCLLWDKELFADGRGTEYVFKIIGNYWQTDKKSHIRAAFYKMSALCLFWVIIGTNNVNLSMRF